MRNTADDPAKLGQSLEPAYGRVSRMRGLADIVEKLLSVVGPERNAPVGSAGALPDFLFTQQGFYDVGHIDIAFQGGRFVEGAVRLFLHIPQMREMDMSGEAPGDG